MRPSRMLVLCVVCALLAGCERGPEPASVRADLQRALDAMAPGLLRVSSINAQGTGPALAAGEVIAYANVALELTRDHDFGGWGGATLGTLASTLGATDRGVRGIRDGGNAAGDRLLVYASAVYAREPQDWRYLGGGAPDPATQAPPAQQSESLLAQVESILARGQDSASTPTRLIERELSTALAQIKQQVSQVQSGAVIAAGPVGGEYAKIAAGLAQVLKARDLQLAVFHSDGSAQNVRLVHSGEVTLGIAQSDVLAQAYAAQGPFAAGEPLVEVVALAALYPEPVHLIVAADSGVTTPADLSGRRVALGAPGSGTRLTAQRVLAAHGLGLGDITRIDDGDLEAAARRLADGEIDAMFATIGAPAGALRRLAARRAIRLLALDEDAVAALRAEYPDYVRHLIAGSSYRGQREPVLTIATTAVLIAPRALLDGLVDHVLHALFFELDHLASGSLQGGLIGPQTATRGLSIALHPAAQRYYAEHAGPPSPERR